MRARLDEGLVGVLESAARLQELVPDAELVGGRAAARVRPGKIILGRLGDIEAGVRQLIRRTPLQVTELTLPSGRSVRVPTPDETLRVKAFLIVRRNQVRDYLDVVALAERYGADHAARVLSGIDDLYADQHDDGRGSESRGPDDEWSRLMSVTFRNVDASPSDPVDTWPFEAVVTALERGGIDDWRRLATAIQDEPWGRVARYVEQAVVVAHPYGVSELMTEIIERARRTVERSERDEVAAVRDLVAASGCTRAQFALDVGTSPSRLSTYAGGSVVPSATMMVRMRRVARRRGAARSGN